MISERLFFTILDIRLFETAHPLPQCTYNGFSRQMRKNNVSEMTDLLQYWPILEFLVVIEIDQHDKNRQGHLFVQQKLLKRNLYFSHSGNH